MPYDWEAARARTLGPAARLERVPVPLWRRLWLALRGKDAPRRRSVAVLTDEGERIARALDNIDPKDVF